MTVKEKLDNHTALMAWTTTVRAHLPQLSKPQLVVLALWSFGMVMIQSCGLTTVASFLAELVSQKENTLRQRLREWYWEAPAKKGPDRQDLDVTTCFGPLVRWVLDWWPATERRLALAMDASVLGARLVVLSISLGYRGCAIPVAWVVLPANKKGAWKPQWLALLGHLEYSIPRGWTVIVLTDRGLYAPWLYQRIVKLHWHPFMRINAQGKYQRTGETWWWQLATVVPAVGHTWSGTVQCFKSQPLECTLLARWDAGQAETWLLITDLAPEQADACWYGMRTWIECGYKDTKRGGWQWQNTRITDPERATRFWLAIAVATLWVVSVGGEADATLPASSLAELPPTHVARRTTNRSRPRLVSCFRRGILVIVAALINGRALPLGRFCLEPWPMAVSPGQPQTASP